MDLLGRFKLFLVSQDVKLAPSSIKNYCADVKHFIEWYEKTYRLDFDPSDISPYLARVYKNLSSGNNALLSEKTLKRHTSSLIKFFDFLIEHKIASFNPFENKQSVKSGEDSWKLSDFKKYLFKSGVSGLTVKNYIHDISKYIQWYEKISKVNENYLYKVQEITRKISNDLVKEYKERLISAHFAPSSINRSLSSLRRYIKYINVNRSKDSQDIDTPTLISTRLPSIDHITVESKPIKNYSRLAPVRLFQRLSDFYSVSEDRIVTFISNLSRNRRSNDGKKLAHNGILENIYPSNIQKAIYAPLQISTKGYPFYKKILHHIRYTRPKWYKSYHKYPIVHYAHLTILITAGCLFAIVINNNLMTTQGSKNILGTFEQSPNYLRFEAKLYDELGNPIVGRSTVRFGLYEEAVSSTSARIWDEVQEVTPSEDGTISVLLGVKNPFPNLEILNKKTYIGVSIGESDELTPRYPIANVPFSEGANTLSGMLPITKSDSLSNTILSFDSSGSLIINGSPKFQALNGDFFISGETLVLASNIGSNGNIEIVPDGQGFIDLQKPLINSTLFGTTLPGSVEVFDNFTVHATESAQAAFIVNNDFVGADILSASSSGLTRFVISSGGNVGIGTANPLYKLQVDGDAKITGNTILNNLSYQWPASQSANQVLVTNGAGELSWANPSSLFNANFEYSNGALFPTNNSADLFIGGSSLDSAKFVFTNSATPTASISGNLILNSLGKIQTTKFQSLTIGGDTTGNISLQPLNNQSGRVKIGQEGVVSPLPDLLVLDYGSSDPEGSNGAMYYNSILNKFRCFENGEWKDCDTDTIGSADIAELYKSNDQKLGAGDIVELDKNNSLYVKKSSQPYSNGVLGVISTRPGIILKDDNNQANDIPVALVGRVPVKIAPSSPDINIGDYLTSSTEGGRASKAEKAGFVIGKALEKWSIQDHDESILVFVEPGYQGQLSANSSIPDDLDGVLYTSQVSPNNSTSMILSAASSLPVFSQNIVKALENLAINTSSLTTRSLNVLSESIYVANLPLRDYIAKIVGEEEVANVKSPLASIDEIKTNLITPLSDNSKIAIELDENRISIKDSASSSASTVVTIDGGGNISSTGTISASSATISGSLAASSLNSSSINSENISSQNIDTDELSAKDASIAGTLRADKIIAGDIEGLDQRISDYTGQIASKYNNEQQTDTVNELIESAVTSDFVDISSISAQFAYVKENFLSLGTATIQDLEVIDALQVGNSLKISSNSIDVIGSDLQIQPFRQGGISFLSGLIRFDTSGNMLVAGSADFESNVNVKGLLSTNFISPLPLNDLTIQIGQNKENEQESSSDSAEFRINNSDGSSVLAVNSSGDITASGSASFNKINFNLVSKALALSDQESYATTSAGTAQLKVNRKELTIYNPLLNSDSLVYITATGDTQGLTINLIRQTGNSFTIGTNKTTPIDIPFNWIIIN